MIPVSLKRDKDTDNGESICNGPYLHLRSMQGVTKRVHYIHFLKTSPVVLFDLAVHFNFKMPSLKLVISFLISMGMVSFLLKIYKYIWFPYTIMFALICAYNLRYQSFSRFHFKLMWPAPFARKSRISLICQSRCSFLYCLY